MRDLLFNKVTKLEQEIQNLSGYNDDDSTCMWGLKRAELSQVHYDLFTELEKNEPLSAVKHLFEAYNFCNHNAICKLHLNQDSVHNEIDKNLASVANKDYDLLFFYGLQSLLGVGMPMNSESAFQYFQLAANKNNSYAQYFIARMYNAGIGVNQNHEQAFKWIKLSAEENYAVAQQQLGVMCISGDGVIPTNYELAVHWFRLAAEQGNAAAQYSLGISYAEGCGIKQSYDRAFHWFRKAGEQGCIESQYSLGTMYYSGQGIQQNFKLAFHWTKLAAEKEHSRAASNIAVFYERGVGVEKNAKLSFHWYSKAANHGNAEAQRCLGSKYFQGDGVEKDATHSFYWTLLAAEQGHPVALNNLGVMYEQGLGIKQSDKLAVYCYTKAAELGDPSAQEMLGNKYFYGIGIDQDIKSAIYWWRKAADQGVPTAQFNLGEQYRTGQGILQDTDRANYWFSLAKKNGVEKNIKEINEIIDPKITGKIINDTRNGLKLDSAFMRHKLEKDGNLLNKYFTLYLISIFMDDQSPYLKILPKDIWVCIFCHAVDSNLTRSEWEALGFLYGKSMMVTSLDQCINNSKRPQAIDKIAGFKASVLKTKRKNQLSTVVVNEKSLKEKCIDKMSNKEYCTLIDRWSNRIFHHKSDDNQIETKNGLCKNSAFISI